VGSAPFGIAITPDGKTAYVSNGSSGTVTPIEVATNTAGTAITVGSEPGWIAITPPAPPTAEIKSPLSGGKYKQGEVIHTKFSCKEGEGGTGIASCKDENGVPSSEEGTLETTMLGSHTYTVTAKSNDGLEGKAKIEYSVEAAPPACKTAEGTGSYKKRGETGRLNLRDRLSTNTAESDVLQISSESGAVRFGLTKLTSASCGVVEGGFAFSGEGPAREYKKTGYTIHFSISVIKGKTYFSSTLTKGSEKIHEAVGEPLSKSNEVIH
jgi:YVTN family beta-propeller protein